MGAEIGAEVGPTQKSSYGRVASEAMNVEVSRQDDQSVEEGL